MYIYWTYYKITLVCHDCLSVNPSVSSTVAIILTQIRTLDISPRDGNGSVGHGSWVKWVTIFGWVTYPCDPSTANDPLTHDDEINDQ